MRALTLRQPWAYAVTHLGKDVENRWNRPPNTLHNHRIAIHAGLALDDTASPPVDPPDVAEAARLIKAQRGCIVATARIAGWYDERGCGFFSSGDYHEDEILESVWYIGPVGILLRDVVVLPKPVPCRGMQGYWPIPADIEAQIHEEVAV